ncbi:hypothetical protein Dsin_027398 [Dipteronia sinensis]|uniref:Uncharacterized protein n=1 Tax=Dipteronia sinensis TaxID=43782 RepID=A0AAD9ZPU5_9ROSI|nr:hypothetical protein Dsin_027398 [Dipteronia sinensis]
MFTSHFQTQIRSKVHTTSIMFTDEDSSGVFHQHVDALVLSLTIAGKMVSGLLVDTKSSLDIIFKKTLDQLGIEKAKLKDVSMPLYGPPEKCRARLKPAKSNQIGSKYKCNVEKPKAHKDII